MNQHYYNELKNIPELTKEEFEHHFKRYKDGYNESKDLIIKSNLKLAVYFAKLYYKMSGSIELDDLVMEANFGLFKALEYFNLDKNIQFSFYASYFIKNALNDFIRSHKSKPVVMTTFEDFKPFSESKDYDEIYNEDDIDCLELYLELIKPRDREIIELFYGFNGETLGYKEIAKQYNISERRVYQIKDEVITQLKKLYENEI